MKQEEKNERAVERMMFAVAMIGIWFGVFTGSILNWGMIDTNVFEYEPRMATVFLFALLGLYFTCLLLSMVAGEILPKTEEEKKLQDKIKALDKKYKGREIIRLKRKELKAEFKLDKVRKELMEFKK
jgi:hypothetical protein